MSKTMHVLRELEKNKRARTSAPVTSHESLKNRFFTPEDLSLILTSKATERQSRFAQNKTGALEEFDIVWKEIVELQEKQEAALSRMSDILEDIGFDIKRDRELREAMLSDETDFEDLEDLIFIGREKG